MIKNIILDVGRVLVSWEWEPVFERLGFDAETQKRVAEATVYAPEWSEFDRSVRSDAEILQSLIRNAPEYEEPIRQFWKHIDETIVPYPYAMEFVKCFKDRGYQVYILSNYSRYTYHKTQEALKVTELADGRIFSFQVGCIKPEARIYQLLLERYHLVPEECLFMDDSPVNIKAADALGIQTLLFSDYDQVQKQLKKMGI